MTAKIIAWNVHEREYMEQTVPVQIEKVFGESVGLAPNEVIVSVLESVGNARKGDWINVHKSKLAI